MEQIHEFQILEWQKVIMVVIQLLLLAYYTCFRCSLKTNSLFVVFLFFCGSFSDLSDLLLGNNTIAKVYQIGMLTWSIILFISNNAQKIILEHKITSFLFLTYVTYFFFCGYFHGDNIFVIISQLSKLLTPIFFIFALIKIFEEEQHEDFFWLFWDLVILQIVMCIIKMFVLGGFQEGWVGSLSGIHGGACGTTLPLIGLFLFAIKTDLKINNMYSVLYLVGLLLVGFATGKRAVWVLFPILYFILSFYVYRRSIVKKLAIVIVLLPLILYVALRLSPTLNPDKKVGGEFNLEYAINYGLKYSAGIDERHENIQSGVGRLGAVSWMLERVNSLDNIALFGKGIEYIATADLEDYDNKNYYQGIASRGSLTGIVKTFMSLGIIGVVLFLLFFMSLFLQNRSRFGLSLMFTVLFDYFFYNSSILEVGALLTMTFYLFLYPQNNINFDYSS